MTGQALRNLLETQRRLLLSGDVDGLAALLSEMAPLAEAARTATLSEREAAEIRAMAERNAQICKAGADGVAAAISTLRSLRSGAPSLETYTEKGTRRSVPTGNAGQSRRV